MYLIISKICTAPYQPCSLQNRCVLLFTQAQTERLHCKSTTNFASCKTKQRLFLVVCKNPCTFAAKLVFHNLYNHSERNQQRLLIPLF